MADDLELFIHPDGTVQYVYSDLLAGALADVAGEVRTARASHVEPAGRAWQADMSPVGGPVLGPLSTRQAALDAETAWLRAEMSERKVEVR